MAGVNAFGFGGINAHLVLTEHPSARTRPAAVTQSSPVQGPTPATEEVLLLAGHDAADLLAQL